MSIIDFVCPEKFLDQQILPKRSWSRQKMDAGKITQY